MGWKSVFNRWVYNRTLYYSFLTPQPVLYQHRSCSPTQHIAMDMDAPTQFEGGSFSAYFQEIVATCDDALLHGEAWLRVGEPALLGRPRAILARKLPTDLQFQPRRIPLFHRLGWRRRHAVFPDVRTRHRTQDRAVGVDSVHAARRFDGRVGRGVRRARLVRRYPHCGQHVRATC